MEVIERGWDHLVLVLDDEVVFRLPRTHGDADLVGLDLALLQAIRDRLPIDVPEPLYEARDLAIVGYRKLSGRAVTAADMAGNLAEAERLGVFLDCLHRTPISVVLDAGFPPFDPDVWRSRWVDAWRRYRPVLGLFPTRLHDELEARWDRWVASEEALDWPPTLVHGDLTDIHVLWDGDRIGGVIDWSDAELGDPAIDFAWIATLPDAVTAAVLGRYSARPTAGLARRAAFFAWAGWWSEAAHGLAMDDDYHLRRGIAGVVGSSCWPRLPPNGGGG